MLFNKSRYLWEADFFSPKGEANNICSVNENRLLIVCSIICEQLCV